MRFVRSRAANLKTVGSRVAVYVAGRQAIHVLNSTAQLLFEYLAEPASLEELAVALEIATRGDVETIRGDLQSVLDEFIDYGIIEQCDS